MQFPITIGLRRSRLQTGLLLLSGLLAVALILSVPWPTPVQGLLIVLLSMLLVHVLRRLSSAVTGLHLAREGILSVQFSGAEGQVLPVILRPGATVHPWLTVLRIEHAMQTSTLLITPDCMAPDDFRRLRVWLKWQAIFGESGVAD